MDSSFSSLVYSDIQSDIDVSLTSSSYFLSHFSSKRENMYWSLVSIQIELQKVEDEVGLVVTSVEILRFYVDPYCVLVEGDIMRNKVLGLYIALLEDQKIV